MNIIDVVKLFAVPGDIFIPIRAHVFVISQAMMLEETVILILDATE